MKKLLIILICLPMIGFGQQSGDLKTNEKTIVRTKQYSKIPSYIKFIKSEQITINQIDIWLNKFYESDGFTLRIIDSKTDELGFSHYRYQQIINGYPVELSRYNVHLKNESIVSMNGVLFSDENISAIQISESDALSNALRFINAEKYNWQDRASIYSPKAELVVINKDGDINKELV